MEGIIDRFEGDYAVIEYNHKVFHLPKEVLPLEAREGDVVQIKVYIHTEKTNSLKKETEKLMKDLWER